MKENLMQFGLSENQATIYIILLRHGETSPSAIAGFSGINRSTIYQELESLLQQGLVSYVIKDSKRYYNAAPPEKLLEILDAKRKNIDQIIPSLNHLTKSAAKKTFRSEVYEGKEGVKAFYQHILNNKPKEVLAFGVTGLAFEVLRYSFPQFLEKYMKAGLKARYLANQDAKKLLESLPKSSVRIKYLPKECHSDVTTVIYGDFTAIQSLVAENIQVVLIEDKHLAYSYKNYFEFMWSNL